MTNIDIKKILVVDDDKIFGHSMERHLRREGFDVVIAYDGRMAREMVLAAELEGRAFELAITDIMVNMDGFAFVSWLQRKFPKVPVMIVTGFGNMTLINKILRTHLDLLHHKPVLPQEIMCSIQKLNKLRQGSIDQQKMP